MPAPHNLIRYATTEYLVDTGPLTFKMEALTDFERTIDQMFAEKAFQTANGQKTERELLDQCPYFAALWPAARALGRALADLGTSELSGRYFLELGCGLALPGFVASRCGAVVTVSDFHPDVPHFLRRNSIANEVSGVRYWKLDWSLIEEQSKPDEYSGAFDVIAGSDLLYDPHQPALLAALIRRLSHAGTRVLIADPGRAYLQEFHNLLVGDGFKVTTQVVVAEAFYGAPAAEILVLSAFL